MTQSLENLDQLIDDLRHAMSTEDWGRFGELNRQIRPSVERVVAGVAGGEYTDDMIRQRLEELQVVCDHALEGAQASRAEAKNTLEEIRQNRKALSAYHDVSTNRYK